MSFLSVSSKPSVYGKAVNNRRGAEQTGSKFCFAENVPNPNLAACQNTAQFVRSLCAAHNKYLKSRNRIGIGWDKNKAPYQRTPCKRWPRQLFGSEFLKSDCHRPICAASSDKLAQNGSAGGRWYVKPIVITVDWRFVPARLDCAGKGQDSKRYCLGGQIVVVRYAPCSRF